MKKRNEEINRKTEAFVCVNTEMGDEEETLSFLQGLPGVDEAKLVYGVWDIVAKVSAPNRDELTKLITEDIRGNNSIRSTLTMMVVSLPDI